MYPTLFTQSNDRNEIRPMDREESQLLIQLSLAPKREENARLLFASVPAPPIVKIMIGRLKMTQDLKFDELVVLWCAELAQGNPGRAVMWAYSLVSKTRQLGKVVHMDDWCEASPWGVPTDYLYDRTWDAQKVGGENGLDTAEAWEVTPSEKLQKLRDALRDKGLSFLSKYDHGGIKIFKIDNRRENLGKTVMVCLSEIMFPD